MINLLPPEIKESRLYAFRNRSLIRSTAFMVFALLILGSMLGYGYFDLNHTANVISEETKQKQAQLGDIAAIEKEAQTLADTISTASTLLEREVKFSELITQIAGLMPEGAALTSLRLTGDKTLPLEITASLTGIEQAPTLQKNLITSELFEAADIQEVKRQAATAADGTVTGEVINTTTIVASFKKPVDTTTQKPKAALPGEFKP